MKYLSVYLFMLLFATLWSASGSAHAQIGQPVSSLQPTFDKLGMEKVLGGYKNSAMRVTTLEKGSALYSLQGAVKLDEAGIAQFSEVVGAVTGYGAGIAQPIAEFLRTRAAEIANRGKVPLNVEEYLLTLNLEGDEVPYSADFVLELNETPNLPNSAHSIGPKNAKFVIREFSDFQCPYCAQFASQVMPQIKEKLLERGDVRFEYHNFPLVSIHANAQMAAEAAECVTTANRPEDFWRYHDALFLRQQAWSSLGDPAPYFVRLAQDVGLSAKGVAACLKDGTYRKTVEDAFNTATALGLNSTPTVFINGVKMPSSAAMNIASYEAAILRLEALNP